ncbi:MAG TPA: AraC family transcriptional regulator [Gemmatimonadaceae bacterium]
MLSAGVPTEPCDRIVFATPDVVAGKFRCPTSYAGFATAGRIHYHVVAFPRSSVWIERGRVGRFVADPRCATLYNPGQPYLRHPISFEGDVADWIGVSETVARDLIRSLDPAQADTPEPFRQAWAPVGSALYLAQRRVFASLSGDEVDALDIEEQLLAIVNAVLRSAYRVASPVVTRRVAASRRDVVERAKAVMMERLFENLGVASLATAVGVSPFHLCRVFREETGTTLSDYRRDVRLRVVLGLTPKYRGNLAALAIHAGFYSHSHLATAFRHAFGVAPSSVLAS